MKVQPCEIQYLQAINEPFNVSILTLIMIGSMWKTPDVEICDFPVCLDDSLDDDEDPEVLLSPDGAVKDADAEKLYERFSTKYGWF